MPWDFGYTARLRQRLVAAEAAVAEATQRLEAMELMHRNRAALISITVVDGANRFGFVRNGQLHYIETFSTTADKPAEWRRLLLEGDAS